MIQERHIFRQSQINLSQTGKFDASNAAVSVAVLIENLESHKNIHLLGTDPALKTSCLT
jgi:hypothetical protein